MNRKLVAVGVVSILAIAGVSIVLVLNPYGTDFHLEERFPIWTVDSACIQLEMYNLRDCCLNISFVNDTSLMYRIDIQLGSAAFRNSAFAFQSQYVSYELWQVYLNAWMPMRSVNIVLGTGKPYDLRIGGTNLTSTVVYSNGSLLTKVYNNGVADKTEFSYGASGSLLFVFLQDVSYTEQGVKVVIGRTPSPNSATVFVELPVGLHGWFHYSGNTTAYLVFANRWFWRGVGNYGTDVDEPDPLLNIYVASQDVVAYLG